jgi:hypothetical protein
MNIHKSIKYCFLTVITFTCNINIQAQTPDRYHIDAYYKIESINICKIFSYNKFFL